MKGDLIEPERISTIQEAICEFLLDEVINPNGEFYANYRISVGNLIQIGTMLKAVIFEVLVRKQPMWMATCNFLSQVHYYLK